MQKRFEMRRGARVSVEVLSPVWESPLVLNSSDLSPRGLYIECENLLALDLPVVCSFSLSRNYHVSGRVSRINRHRRKTDSGRPGFGVEFTHVRPLTRISIRADLRGLPPPVPHRRPEGFRLESTGLFIPVDG